MIRRFARNLLNLDMFQLPCLKKRFSKNNFHLKTSYKKLFRNKNFHLWLHFFKRYKLIQSVSKGEHQNWQLKVVIETAHQRWV